MSKNPQDRLLRNILLFILCGSSLSIYKSHSADDYLNHYTSLDSPQVTISISSSTNIDDKFHASKIDNPTLQSENLESVFIYKLTINVHAYIRLDLVNVAYVIIFEDSSRNKVVHQELVDDKLIKEIDPAVASYVYLILRFESVESNQNKSIIFRYESQNWLSTTWGKVFLGVGGFFLFFFTCGLWRLCVCNKKKGKDKTFVGNLKRIFGSVTKKSNNKKKTKKIKFSKKELNERNPNISKNSINTHQMNSPQNQNPVSFPAPASRFQKPGMGFGPVPQNMQANPLLPPTTQLGNRSFQNTQPPLPPPNMNPMMNPIRTSHPISLPPNHNFPPMNYQGPMNQQLNNPPIHPGMMPNGMFVPFGHPQNNMMTPQVVPNNEGVNQLDMNNPVSLPSERQSGTLPFYEVNLQSAQNYSEKK